MEKFAFIEGEPVETTLQVGAMGKLEEEILKSGLQPRDINFLTIEGKLDNADFKLIRDYMPNLVSVDISRTNATAIPDFTFSQKKYLLRMKLPHNLKSIGQLYSVTADVFAVHSNFRPRDCYRVRRIYGM